MFSSRLSTARLLELFRALKHQIGAGLTVRDAFRQQARAGNPAVRPLCARVVEGVERGESLGDVLDREKIAFPPIVMPLIRVGEETGKLPEILGELERYMELEEQRKREFRQQAMVPLFQFGAAVLVISLLIWILGVIAEMNNKEPIRIFGLAGGQGSLVFLGSVVSVVALLYLFWTFAPRFFGGGRMMGLLMKVPVIGKAIETLALSRFALGLHLTLDAGIPIVRALKLSFDVSDNSYFQSKSANVEESLKKGEKLLEALTHAGIFPSLFLEMIASAEEAGRVPEMMKNQAEYLHDEATRRIAMLVKISGGVVWLTVAGFIIWAIFSIFTVYVSALKSTAG